MAFTPDPSAPEAGGNSRFAQVPQMRFPNHYLWLVLVSAMDVMLTWLILSLGGSEANPIARLVIDAWGLPGAIAFKFGLMLIVIVICEVVSRTREQIARWLVYVAIIISAMPVVYSLTLLALHVQYL